MITPAGGPERLSEMADEMRDVTIIETEEYDHDKFQRRQNSLTEKDLENITSIIEDTVGRRVPHAGATCRFGDITHEDLKAMVDSHKKFSAAMDDSKTIARRFLVISILTGMGGIALIGWWETVVNNVKKALTGN